MRVLGLLVLACSVVWSSGGQVSRGVLNLGHEIAASLEKSTGNNFVFSPYSAHSAFSQLLIGSEGRTRQELENVLGVTEFDTQEYSSVRDNLQSSQSSLSVANLMAVAQGFKPKSSYNLLLGTRFNSNVRELDFTNGADVANQVNRFVSDVTNGKISDLLSDTSTDSLTRLILVNAIYFKAPWKTTFDRDESFPAKFNSPTGEVETTYMSGKQSLRFLNDPNNKVEIVELPYSDPTKSMLLVLPTATGVQSNIVDLIRNLDLGSIRDQTAEDAVVSVPSFTIRTSTDLKTQMQNLGVTSAFSEDANLSGITDEEIYATDAIHDAYIEVTEEGTEAAAATAISIGVRTSKRSRQFFADRPFLFIIYDFSADMPLFMGKVTNPSDTGLAPATRSGVNLGGTFDAVPDDYPEEGDNTEADSSAANLDPSSSSSTGGASTNVGSANCNKYIADFPNAFENVKLCQRAEQLKMFDWLRTARQVCEQSTSLHDKFVAESCGPQWCATAADKKQRWALDNQELCASDVLTRQNPIKCKNIANHLAAYVELKCA